MNQKNIKLIYAWDDKKFKWSKEDLNSVYYNLKKQGYSLKKEKPDEYILKIINRIVTDLLEDKWIMLLSNSYKLLSQLSIHIPITYSLTSMYSCMNVNSNDVYKAIYESSFDDNVLNNMKLTTLLYWNNILEINPNASKYSGGFFDLLNIRAKRKCSTVFTHLYFGSVIHNKVMKIMETNLLNLFGAGAVSIIREKISIIDIPGRDNNSWESITRI